MPIENINDANITTERSMVDVDVREVIESLVSAIEQVSLPSLTPSPLCSFDTAHEQIDLSVDSFTEAMLLANVAETVEIVTTSIVSA